MQRLLTAAVALLGAAVCLAADTREGIPDGYTCVYKQDFAGAGAIGDFVFTDPKAWKSGEAAGRKGLAYDNSAKYKPKVRSPRIIALIKDIQVKDFVLEADICQTGKEYGHRDACLFYGFTNPSNFYYTHIATKADPHAHNIFLVKDKPRTAIATKTTKGINWGQKVTMVQAKEVAMHRAQVGGTPVLASQGKAPGGDVQHRGERRSHLRIKRHQSHPP